jgi:integrase
VTPHTLRHTALTWLEEEGIPIEMISKLAAHSGPDITRQVYLHARPEVLRPAADAIERRLQQQLLPAPTKLKSENAQH